MFFDTSTFDFDSLKDDIVGIADTPTRHKEPESTYRTENDDISDLVNGYQHEESEPDFNDDVSDLAITDQRNGVNLTDYFNAADDNAVLDLEGLTLTKAEIKELYKAKHKVDHDAGYFAEQAERFDADNRLIMQRSIMQQSVLENNINILRNRKNNPNISEVDYARTCRDLEIAETGLQRIIDETNQIMHKRSEQEQLINGYRIRSEDQAMYEIYPQWDKLKGDVLNYAANLGVSSTALEKLYSKPIMQALTKAMLYDNGKKSMQEKLASTQSKPINPRSTVGAKTSTRNVNQSEADKAKAAKALKNMGGSRQANVAAFAFLKD